MFTLHLAGSEVRALRMDGDRLCIEFSAACVAREAADVQASGQDRHEMGYLKPLSLWLDGVQWHPQEQTASLTDCFGAVAQGQVRIDGQAIAALRLPLAERGVIDLTLSMQARDTWCCTARQLRCDIPDNARFIASMAC
ncbi:MAG TPA: hypothetical protein VFH49_13385 [Aquabacterium sp.]|nr:hypothetical protein [Aquabacterium sp.]